MSTGALPTRDHLTIVSTCDYSFGSGGDFLVFADGPSPASMKAHACGETRTIAHAAETMNHLDAIAPRRAPSAGVDPNRSVAVVGFVRNPGVVPWTPGMTVAEAISLAGGISPAEPRWRDTLPPDVVDRILGHSRVVRGDGSKTIQIRVALTTPVLCDDELIIGRDMRQ